MISKNAAVGRPFRVLAEDADREGKSYARERV
jgi:hypothetical protein